MPRKLNDADVNRVKILLKEKKLTQKEIAKVFGVSLRIIQEINMGLYGQSHKRFTRPDPPKEEKGGKSTRKLTFKQAQEIRIKYAKGTTKLALAVEYGVSDSTIQAIIKNERYLK